MPRKHSPQKHQPYQHHQQCEMKRAFKTQDEAIKAAELQMLKDMNLELDIYSCQECQRWHLTRQTSKK